MRCLRRLWNLELAVALAVALTVHAILSGSNRRDSEEHGRQNLRELQELDTLVGARSDNGGTAVAKPRGGA